VTRGVRRRTRFPSRARTALLVGLTVLLVGAGGTAGHALWASTATTAVTKASTASVAATSTGFEKLAGALTPTDTTRTAAVVVTNTGSTSGPWRGTITTAPANDADRALAAKTRVTAWPATVATCTATTAPPSGALVGSWAVPPVLSGTLAPQATATWCVRTVTDLAQPTDARVTATLTTVLGAGSWKGTAATQAAQTTTAPLFTGGFTCAQGDRYVQIGWSTSWALLGATYDLTINGTHVAYAQGMWPYAIIQQSSAPASIAPDGPVRVTVSLVRSDGSRQVVATGTIIAETRDGYRGYRCS
jgi:hypothetical protein